MKPEPRFLDPALFSTNFSASFVAVSWVNSTQACSVFPPRFLCRDEELALTGSGWCPDRGMMGRGNGKCYPTLLRLHGRARCVSPYTSSSLPPSSVLLTFTLPFFAVFSLCSFLLLAPRPPLSSLGSAALRYNGAFLAEWAQHFLDACVLSYLTMGKRSGAWGFHREHFSDHKYSEERRRGRNLSALCLVQNKVRWLKGREMLK